jgi:hypothetical protein
MLHNTPNVTINVKNGEKNKKKQEGHNNNEPHQAVEP